MIQGGDITGQHKHVSSFGEAFEQDATALTGFDKPMRLCMAQAGSGLVACQFFVTTAPAPHLEGKYEVCIFYLPQIFRIAVTIFSTCV